MPGPNSTRPGSGSCAEACLVFIAGNSDRKIDRCQLRFESRSVCLGQWKAFGQIGWPANSFSALMARRQACAEPPGTIPALSDDGNAHALLLWTKLPAAIRVFRESMLGGLSEFGEAASGKGSAEGFLPPLQSRGQANMPSSASLPASRISAGKSGTTTLRGPSSLITPSRFRADICRLTVSMVRPR